MSQELHFSFVLSFNAFANILYHDSIVLFLQSLDNRQGKDLNQLKQIKKVTDRELFNVTFVKGYVCLQNLHTGAFLHSLQ